MIKENIIFLGATKFSEEILKALIENNCKITAIFSIPKFFNISYSDKKVENINYTDLSKYSNQLNIPFYTVDSIEGKKLKDFSENIREISPKVIIAAGWYYMIPKTIRDIPTYGVWGLHSSLLPKYAGGAPLVWAIINGEKETGVTLFKMDNGVDDGDIIFQNKIEIKEKDHIRHVLKKAIHESIKIVLKAVNQEKIELHPQDRNKLKIFPQRNPRDGEINWDWDPIRIKNFVRAQSKPYPGAWSNINGIKVYFWNITDKQIKYYKLNRNARV